jgi:hypothetical protein
VNQSTPSFLARILIAFRIFFRALADPAFAAGVAQPQTAEQLAKKPVRATEAPTPSRTSFREALPDSALQLLGLLQQEGRLVDFLEEDVAGFADSDIGAAARVVHQGCRKAVHDHLKIVPVRQESEGSRITLQQGFDASSIRLAGNVVGNPPFNGRVVHRGWRVESITLPKIAEGHDVKVLAPAEVEL